MLIDYQVSVLFRAFALNHQAETFEGTEKKMMWKSSCKKISMTKPSGNFYFHQIHFSSDLDSAQKILRPLRFRQRHQKSPTVEKSYF